MNGGRPRTPIGSYGVISISRRGTTYVALARIRDADGRLRRVTGAARTESAARARLKERLLDRPGFGSRGLLDLSSSFRDLADLWLEDHAPALPAKSMKTFGIRDATGRLSALPLTSL